jgi:hypothetical protein
VKRAFQSDKDGIGKERGKTKVRTNPSKITAL